MTGCCAIILNRHAMKIRCPICKRITTWEENPFKPFCSERCKLIDLGKWASEDYRVEGEEPAKEEEGGKGEKGGGKEREDA